MRRIPTGIFTLVLLLGMCAVGHVSAQPRLHAPSMYIGAQAGVSASATLFSPTVENLSLQSIVWGGNAGVVFRYAEHKVCGVQAELNYMQRGWGESSGYQRRLHYLEIPVLTHLYFGRGNCKGFFNIGPQIGVCVYDNCPTTTDNAEQHQPIAKRFDWGAAAGLGGLYHTARAGTYQLEARFNYSLGALYGTRAVDYFKMANPMCITLNIAWLWPLNAPIKHVF